MNRQNCYMNGNCPWEAGREITWAKSPFLGEFDFQRVHIVVSRRKNLIFAPNHFYLRMPRIFCFCRCSLLVSLSCLLLPSGAFAQQTMPFGKAITDKIAAAECAHASCKHVVLANVLTDDYDVSYYRCEWAVDPAVKAISGAITVYFKPKAGDFSIFHADLHDDMTLDSVRYHGAKITSHHPTGHILDAMLPAPLAMGVPDSLTMYYHGAPPTTGFGAFTQTTHGANNTPVIWTLSEPYGASDWWPCKNTTNDKADSLDVIVTTGSAYRAAGNGLLVEETAPAAGKKRYHWRHRYPITAYLVAIAVTDYEQFTHKAFVAGDSLPILNYVYPENYAQWKTDMFNTVDIMELYSTLFEPYPYRKEKYGHAQFSWGGGQEHQTMSFMTSADYSLQAHELAHQWFGNKITCGSFQDIWLNEGFATFLTGLSLEHLLGGQWWVPWKIDTRDNVLGNPNGSVFVPDTTDLWRIFNGRLSYAKGAMLLHQLRWLMGDSAFFAGLQSYLADPSLAYARTPDLQKHLEAASGRSLTEYFNDWLYGEGWPTYDVHWQQDIEGNFWVEMNQASSHPSVSFFEMKVPILFSDGAGKDTVIVFDNTHNGQVFSFYAPDFYFNATFDPEVWRCAKNTLTYAFTRTESLLEGAVTVGPVPATDRLDIATTRGVHLQSAVLYDLTGRPVASLAEESPQKTAQEGTILLSGLNVGIYLAKITTDKGTITRKVVKQ